jgi:hypothetical protein
MPSITLSILLEATSTFYSNLLARIETLSEAARVKFFTFSLLYWMSMSGILFLIVSTVGTYDETLAGILFLIASAVGTYEETFAGILLLNASADGTYDETFAGILLLIVSADGT